MPDLAVYKKINGNALKIVACVTMFIDHIGAGFMLPYVRYGYYDGNLSIDQLNMIYKALRMIGRTAFPVFCFLLVEGFIHTRSRLRYALSLLLFGIISEIPFDLLFFAEEEIDNINMISALKANSYLIWNQCNVYFTLLIGLLVIWGIESTKHFLSEKKAPIYANWLFIFLFIGAGCLTAYKLNTDYDMYGVILITIFYLLQRYDYIRLFAGYLYISQLGLEYASLPGFLLMLLYSKKRGKNLGMFKYLFYLFYPVHLTAIYICRCIVMNS